MYYTGTTLINFLVDYIAFGANCAEIPYIIGNREIIYTSYCVPVI